MKKFFLYALSFILFTINIQPQNDVNITILVKANNLPSGSSIYVTGNDAKLGYWQPDAVKLIKNVNGIWSKSFLFKKGEKLDFKITLGSWESEALNDDGSIPSNHSIEVLIDSTIEIVVNRWADKLGKKTEGQITGIVQYHLNMKGKGVKSRDVIVWLPPFYFLDPEKRYPVLYIHDGQNIVDPRTSTFQIDWQIDETADSLIRKGLIEEIIIVGIYNTPDRKSEYSENDTGYAYMNFIVDSLKPFIDKNYRTLPDKKYTATAGSSLAGLISFMLAWEHNHVFSMAASISPAFKIGRYNYVDNVESYKGKKKNIKIYIDNGDNELDSKLQNGIDEMLQALNVKGFVQDEDYFYYKAIKSQHSERDWAKRVWRTLIFLFGTEKGRKLL
ncbi:MAG: alpha/beta hydrolase-fold protein [Ignavibacteriaceae bacterium]|nr:alpha/beta hydrolase-fold protein [Ignavibacteriaceae bacterium]